MCAITGAYAFGPSAPPPRDEDCVAARDAMAARGPDGTGLYRDPAGRVVLGHRRLSIIDLSDAGAQPMAGEDGKSWIVFNGEIYNHRELRAAAEREGRLFRTRSDTEVLLDLHRHEGAAMVRRLRGLSRAPARHGTSTRRRCWDSWPGAASPSPARSSAECAHCPRAARCAWRTDASGRPSGTGRWRTHMPARRCGFRATRSRPMWRAPSRRAWRCTSWRTCPSALYSPAGWTRARSSGSRPASTASRCGP